MKEQRNFWSSPCFFEKIPQNIGRVLRAYIRESKKSGNCAIREQIRDFLVFSKHHEIDCIDDKIIAYIFQCSKMTVFRSRNEDINKKKKKEWTKFSVG